MHLCVRELFTYLLHGAGKTLLRLWFCSELGCRPCGRAWHSSQALLKPISHQGKSQRCQASSRMSNSALIVLPAGVRLCSGCALRWEGLALRIETAPRHANTEENNVNTVKASVGGWSSASSHPNSLNFPYPSLFLCSSQSTPQKNESQRTWMERTLGFSG